MRYLLTLFTATLFFSGVSLTHAQPPEKAVPPAPGTRKPRPPRPEKVEDQIVTDLTALLKVINTAPGYVYSSYIANARPGFFGAGEWLGNWRSRGLTLELVRCQLDNLRDDVADVTVTLRQLRKPDVVMVVDKEGKAVEEVVQDPGRESTEKLRLVRGAVGQFAPWLADGPAVWAVVPPSVDDYAKVPAESLARKALYLQQPPGVLPLIRADEALHRLGGLGLAVLQFLQDYDEVFAFDPEFDQQALQPYMESLTFFKIPGGRGETFSINENLCGNNVGLIKDPANTVLWYDGKPGILNYRYNGKAAVCFADGHRELVDPARAARLIWKP